MAISLQRAGLALGLIVACGAVPTPCRAGEFAGDVPDRIWVDLGGSANDLTTTASLSGEAGVGAVIDFEDVFNLPRDKDTFRLFTTIRIAEKRKYLDVGFVNIDRKAARIIEEDLVWGDYVFQAGGEVTAQFDTRFLYTAFRYDFLNVEKVRIAGSAGLSFVTLGAGLTGDGNVVGPGGPITGEFERESKITAPVPMLGFNVDWAITRRLILRSYTRLFRLNIDAVDGLMHESGVHLNWLFVRHFGLGFGFDKNEIKVDEVEIDDDTGTFDYRVSGFALYLNLAF